MTDREIACPVCSQTWSGRLRCQYADSWLEACTSCHSWVYFPRPDIVQQHSLHDSAEYFDHPYFEARRRIDMTARRVNRLVRLLQQAAPELKATQGRLLDVGCDTGEFMELLGQTIGWDASGLDVASRAVQEACRVGRKAFHCDLSHAPLHLGDFDLITAIDLIEHVADPTALTVATRQRLKAGGLFYFETPNIDSAVYRIGALMCQWLRGHPKALYERLFPPQHVHYFNRISLEALMHRCGFEKVVLASRPLPWQEISTSFAVRSALAPLQSYDRLLDRGIILYGLFRAV